MALISITPIKMHHVCAFTATTNTQYINKDAEVYTRLFKRKPINNKFYSGGGDVNTLVQKVVSSGANIVPDYNMWFEVAGALANVPNGRDLFYAISRIDSFNSFPVHHTLSEAINKSNKLCRIGDKMIKLQSAQLKRIETEVKHNIKNGLTTSVIFRDLDDE